MFKSILPLRRIHSSEFTMVTDLGDTAPNGKENYPALATMTNTAKPPTEKRAKKAFSQLLDELQIPSTIRPKLATMEPSVKAAMLKSSHTLARKGPNSPSGGLRKSHSSESLSSPRMLPIDSSTYDVFRAPTSMSGVPPFELAPSTRYPKPQRPFATAGHARGVSLSLRKNAFASQSTVSLATSAINPGKEKKELKAAAISASRYCSILTGSSTTQLDVETVKKLRLLLRNEAASWTLDFVNAGGYSALLTRLSEILEVEWREEQHDDQILHELLRCFKALSTSAVGCNALRSRAPTPYTQLIALLYSDKKPGEVATRQLIVELLLALFDLYPPSSLPSLGSPNNGYPTHRSQSIPWGVAPSTSNVITLPPSHTTFFSFIRSVLLTPAPPPTEDPRIPVSPHQFIEELHIPRIYKTYLQELSDLCRDYFWVFCHPNNTIWNLDETDEGKVERPRAPGGMTGGVEFEAMSYMTIQFRLINAIANAAQELNLPKEHELSPHRLHSDFFLSGIDRILLIARKASTTYYPTLHLEIARYVTAAGRAGYELPWSVARIIGSPPTAMRKPGSSSRSGRSPSSANTTTTSSVGGSPTKRNAVIGTPSLPQLPTPRKVTPMFGMGP
ncbi:unnamed protein product [Somion occarium]|uniref:Formin GTPase-binding domain-containing protein n=1 Tax=Somion occarium TaxID=3059160 RepID=A0ABP1EDQ3_9APHY